MSSGTRAKWPVTVWACVVFFASGIFQARAAEELEYNRDIRPILASKCFACHGPDSASRKADLRLDQREAAIDMGAIIPGEPEESELIRRIQAEEPEELMPPPETKKSLTAKEKELLARWIASGAEYQLHWSFIPPQRSELPNVEELADVKYADWPRNPLDHFVLARLLAEGLEPAPEADRRTLARRVSLDLTGLPPDPELVQEFVEDGSPRAYEKLVDRLLDSEHWGEHRARYWLDYARYADTHGIHFDNYREMWSYRDWVIRAFNANMPFDQFTVENLAGDLLPNRTLNQQIGSGFNRCNMTTNEGGIIDEEYRVLYARDRTETTSQVWLGLTTGCAVCHDHKFDPVSQREFYEMAAFFNNTTQPVRDGNVRDTPPIVVVPRDEDRELWTTLTEQVRQAEDHLAHHREEAGDDFKTWLASASVQSLQDSLPEDGLYFRAPLDEGEGKQATVWVDDASREVELADSTSWQAGLTGKALAIQGAAAEFSDIGDFSREQAFTCTAWIRVPASDGSGAICARMDNADNYRGWDFWIQRRQIGMHVISSWPEDGLKVVGSEQVPANQWVHVTVSYDGSGKASGVKVYYNGEPQSTLVENDKLSGEIQTEVPFKIGQRSHGASFTGAAQDLRIYRRALDEAEVQALAKLTAFAGALSGAHESLDEETRQELYDFWLGAFDPSYQALRTRLEGLKKEKQAVQDRATIAHVMQEADDPAMAYVLYRGEYDQRRDEVSPGTPEVLPQFPDSYSRDRLGFAQWLLLPDHPLTARVTVNRFWQEVFGTGIVRTTGDFGVSGELPMHPELLDWLAVEFRESGWDVKELFRLIMTSATYRQSAAVTAEKLEKDRANRLFSRGPRFRMDAEMVRDYALASSGLLVRKIGGPSVKPYQPPGVWEAIAMNVSNTRKYEPDSGEALYRRSLYTFIKRMAPPASLEIFNAPNREYCVVRRERTNTPLQALVTLNDEQFVEAARHLAQRALLEAHSSWEARLQFMGQRLLARDFRTEEVEVIRQSWEELSTFYAEHPEDARALLSVGESKAEESLDAAKLAAWTMLANQLMNLDEVLNK